MNQVVFLNLIFTKCHNILFDQSTSMTMWYQPNIVLLFFFWIMSQVNVTFKLVENGSLFNQMIQVIWLKGSKEDSMSDDIDDEGPCSHKTTSSNVKSYGNSQPYIWVQNVLFMEDELSANVFKIKISIHATVMDIISPLSLFIAQRLHGCRLAHYCAPLEKKTLFWRTFN